MDLAHLFFVCTLAGILVYICWVRIKQHLRFLNDFLISCIPVAARSGRIPTSRTPPRSLSPPKRTTSPDIPLGFWDAFPPSCREALITLAQTLPEARRKKLVARDVDQATFENKLIPFTADFVTCGPATYTPTRLSTDQIRALGDFPDYAVLSGVPLPEAYDGFRIETAVPRPYRPLRWAYHQTMCMLNCLKKIIGRAFFFLF